MKDPVIATSFRWLLLFVLAYGLTGCAEDFEMEAPYKPVTVVYGLLNKSEAVNYIRIQRVYAGGAGSAYQGAMVADSNFDKEIVVNIREFDRQNKLVNETILSRVDLNLEGLIKKPGLFFSDYNYAYKYERPLDSTHRYRMVITHKATGIIDSAETGIINPEQFLKTDHIRPSNLPGGLLLVKPSELINYSAFTKPPGAGICWGMLDIYYQEDDINTGTRLKKSVTHYMPFSLSNGYYPKYFWQNPALAFYYFLGTQIEAAKPGIERQLLYCDLSVYAGTEELARYIEASNSWGRGLAGTSMGVSNYTNIRSTSGKAIGIFSAQASQVYLDMPISYTLDSLQQNRFTGKLNFTR